MPELGDVEGFRRVVVAFEGATIARVEILDTGVVRNVSAERFATCLRGKRIGRAKRIGKWLIVVIGDQTVVFHFGMTGSLERGDGEDLRADDRVVFVTEIGEFRYRDLRKLRGIHLAADTDEVDKIIGDIGPDARSVSAAELRRGLGTRRGSIKAGLIDQTRLAGIGNFGSDEILWRAGVHPNTPIRTLRDDEWARLHGALAGVVRATVRAGHTPRGPRWLTGARGAQPARCPTCSTVLERSVVAGRSSLWCPMCQPLPKT